MPQVFVELNELVVDKNQELQWKETARWIKFEEDVEEETDRWGKPHVASLSFRSLLELRKTLSHGREPGLAPWGVGKVGGPPGPSPQSPRPSPRGRAPGPGPEDAARGGPSGGGADGDHGPDPRRGPCQRAAGAAAQAQVSVGGGTRGPPVRRAPRPVPGIPGARAGPPRPALPLSHSHPSDEKDFSFPRNISAGSLGSLLVHHHSTNHVAEGGEPAVTEPLIAGHAAEHDARVDVEREVGEPGVPGPPPEPSPLSGAAPHPREEPWQRPVSPQREVLTPPPPAGITRSKSKHELKLLEKIPDNAEATVVLVGTAGLRRGGEVGDLMLGSWGDPRPRAPW